MRATSSALAAAPEGAVEPARDPAALRAKTRLFAAIVVLTNVAGNSALTKGMQQIGDPGNSPLALIGALFHPWVALGVALLIAWTASHMALLSWADLSYVLPVTSIAYVFTALAGKWLLGETVSLKRWAGIALVTAGVTIVGLASPPSTVKLKPAGEEPQ
jgi:drug/metabolite transporter (DMT)-like permease